MRFVISVAAWMSSSKEQSQKPALSSFGHARRVKIYGVGGGGARVVIKRGFYSRGERL